MSHFFGAASRFSRQQTGIFWVDIRMHARSDSRAPSSQHHRTSCCIIALFYFRRTSLGGGLPERSKPWQFDTHPFLKKQDWRNRTNAWSETSHETAEASECSSNSRSAAVGSFSSPRRKTQPSHTHCHAGFERRVNSYNSWEEWCREGRQLISMPPSQKKEGNMEVLTRHSHISSPQSTKCLRVVYRLLYESMRGNS